MEIKIQIVNNSLQEMGIDQDPEYAILYFREESFHGYWMDEEFITFYVGSGTFVCKNTQKNQELLNNLL